LGANSKLTDGELKEKTIEKLRAECGKLARRVNHFQEQANDAKTKMEKIVKNLSSLFGEDQVPILPKVTNISICKLHILHFCYF
jgi:seryl-tRNA synthetase